MASGYLTSEAYARRLGESFSLFRQAVAHKGGTLGARGGSGYAPPGVKDLASRIAPPSAYYGSGEAKRPLWSLEDVEAFERAGGEASPGNGPPGSRSRARLHPREIVAAADAEAAGLSDRERAVLGRRYGAERASQQEVAKALGISQSLVSRVERNALSKLSAALDAPPADHDRGAGISAGPEGDPTTSGP